MSAANDPLPVIDTESRGRTWLVFGRFVLPVAPFLATIGLDAVTGNLLSTGVLYALSVSVASWRGNLYLGLIIAVLSYVVLVPLSAEPTQFPAAWYEWLNHFVVLFGLIGTAVLSKRVGATYRQVRMRADTDALTGLLNRQGFVDALNRCMRQQQSHAAPFTLVYLDVDRFKAVNDRFGHAQGDELLQRIGSALREMARASDPVGRVGGDEFVILLPEVGHDMAERLAERLVVQLEERFSKRYDIGFSAGLETFDQPPARAEAALAAADHRMYLVKRERQAARPAAGAAAAA